MQLIVLGMHRSGTSIVARLLNMMGAYFGPEGVTLGANEENPKGFWERRDVLDLDDALLRAAGADWWRVAQFHTSEVPADAVERFQEAAARLVLDLDAHRPWFVKEPRLSLVLRFWLPLLDVPVGVFIHRPPIQVAQSLRKRNGFSLAFGIALWERYTLDALKAAAGLPMIRLLHGDFAQAPEETVGCLFEQLQAQGVQGLRMPSEREIRAFIDPELFRQQGNRQLEDQYLNLHQRALARAIEEDFSGLLEAGAAWEISAGGQTQLEAFEEHEQLLRSSAAHEAQAAEHEEALSRQASELGEMEQTLRRREQALAERAAARDQKAADAARLHQAVQEQKQALTAEAAARAQAEEALHTRTQALEVQGSELSEQRAALERAEQALDEQRAAFAEQNERLRHAERASATRGGRTRGARTPAGTPSRRRRADRRRTRSGEAVRALARR